jgi:predicted CopG family antitoxin
MTLYNETMARKTITINEDTHKELVKLGVYGESMDGIIRKLIDHYKGKSNIEVKPTNVD